MYRRSLLKSLAALALLPRVLRAATVGASGLRRVRPSDPDWPDEAAWRSLRASKCIARLPPR